MDLKERSDLLAKMLPQLSSHMRHALGNLHLAAASLVPAEQREKDPELDRRAAVLDQSYYRLLRIANNFSAMEQMCASEPLRLQDRDVVALVEEIWRRSTFPAELLGLQLKFVCEKRTHICAVHYDSLEQLLFQLLSNAFKYTPAGGTVTVEVAVSGRQVRISVADTGCGIDPDRLPNLFEPCPTEETPLPPAGVGLGLPLCRRIAQRHGGSVVAESKSGIGTCVTVALPDRREGIAVINDILFDYSGGFNRTLLGLADALPAAAFRVRNQD